MHFSDYINFNDVSMVVIEIKHLLLSPLTHNDSGDTIVFVTMMIIVISKSNNKGEVVKG